MPAVDALFVGDALTTGHVPNGPQPVPFTLEPHETAVVILEPR